jgi:hypothetical protein
VDGKQKTIYKKENRMNTNDDTEFLVDTDGETSALLAPQKSEMAYIAPAELPDLEQAEVGFSLEAKYLKFTTPGQAVRVVFNGFTTIRKNEGGEVKPMTAAVLQNKDGLFLNATSNILDQLSRVPVGTAVQITYTGDEKTASGYNVKKFDIRVLNVKLTPAFVGESRTEKPAATFPAEKAKPTFANMQMATEYWTKVYSPAFKFTEQDGLDHLAACGNDFKKAIEALEPDAQLKF